MAVTSYKDGSYFLPIRSGNTCPVCGKKDGRCSEFYNAEGVKAFYRCKHKPSSRPSSGWYIHLVKDVDGINPTQNRTSLHTLPLRETPVTSTVLKLRDRVYRKFRELVKKHEGNYLYQVDLGDLLGRGLSVSQIESMGFFSVPSKSKKVWHNNFRVNLQTAIIRDLESEFGDKLLQVPGFVRRTNRKTGNDYISFKYQQKHNGKYQPINGYFIPYSNVEGQLIGLQYRLTSATYNESGKKLRYFWYSSSQARSGSPIDYFVPSNVVRDDVLLVTEGATKGKIACEYLGFRGMFEAGVHNYNNLMKSLLSLEKKTTTKFKIILAFDMDKHDNSDVIKAENETISLLKGTGHQVAVATWDSKSAKGIDDALVLGTKIKYKTV